MKTYLDIDTISNPRQTSIDANPFFTIEAECNNVTLQYTLTPAYKIGSFFLSVSQGNVTLDFLTLTHPIVKEFWVDLVDTTELNEKVLLLELSASLSAVKKIPDLHITCQEDVNAYIDFLDNNNLSYPLDTNPRHCTFLEAGVDINQLAKNHEQLIKFM